MTLISNEAAGISGSNVTGLQSKLPKIHSIAAILTQRVFTGGFEVGNSAYRFTYTPSVGEIADGRFITRGLLTVTDPRGNTRTGERVKATLAAIQGGLGTSPVRRQILAATAQTGTVATSAQHQQQAGTEKTREGEAKKAAEQEPDPSSQLPAIESTGPLSFSGVLYFHFEPLDGRALGVPADLGGVQLNARLAPVDEVARSLQGIYSSIADALHVGDRAATVELIEDLNKILK